MAPVPSASRPNQVCDLVERLVEEQFFVPARDFFPFALRALGELVGVSREALMEEADCDDGFRTAAGGNLCELLEEVDVLALWMEGGELKEFAEFIQDDEQTLRMLARDYVRIDFFDQCDGGIV